VSDSILPIGDGHTLLAPDVQRGLIPTYIATRGELFDAEQRNIAQALLMRAPSTTQLLTDSYLRRLHKAMFGQVWSWAGRYRRVQTNIGIEVGQIAVAVRDLVEDTTTWLEHGTYDHDEAAVRFHHRLVAIHPFPNGNGRHGRIAADLLVVACDRPEFRWGRELGLDTDRLRATYRQALRRADEGEIDSLLGFARA
jgi:Fic-DOC domain mobile mystery protein B